MRRINAGLTTLRPYFKKSENFQAPDQPYQELHDVHFDLDFHGTDGPLKTIYSSEYGASQKYWHATLKELGVEKNQNHASGSSVGTFTAPAGVDPKTQQRCYSAPAYYLPVSHRENLILLTEATVRNVVLEKNGGNGEWVATGVRFMHKAQEYTVSVSGEIIISAGSIQSPQILELSGVGNPQILDASGIETRVANPNVGENLQDHMSIATTSNIIEMTF